MDPRQNTGEQEYSMNNTNFNFNEASSRRDREALIRGYGSWIYEFWKTGWDAYAMAFMFHQLPGSQYAQIQQMHEEITTIYRKLLPLMFRKPKSLKNADLVPRGIFFPDLPVSKIGKESLRDVSVNDGLHMHRIMVAPCESRLNVRLDEHFQQKRKIYQTQKLYRIYVEPIYTKPEYVTEYAGKGLKRTVFSTDDVPILPRSISEFTGQVPALGRPDRRRRDLQARFNLSDETAWELVKGRRRSGR
jgi:hypothetical protein